MGADPWDDPDHEPDRDQEHEDEDIDWLSSVLIVGVIGLIAVLALAGAVNSGVFSDGSTESEPETEANTTEQETVSNETAEATENDSTTQSSDADPGGSDAEDTAPPEDADGDDNETSEPVTEGSSSPAESDSDADSSDTSSETSDTDSESDSDESQEQEQSDDQTEQAQNQSDDEDERPVYDLTVAVVNERPVSGATVTIERHADGATTTRTTGANGEASFSVYEGEYTIRAEDPNGNTETTTVTVEQDTTVDMMTFETPETHTLTVTVVDQTGAPIAGVDVLGTTVDSQDAGVRGTTNAEGVATLDVYEGYTYEINASHPDTDEVVTKEVQVEGDESLHVVLETDSAPSPNQTQSNESVAA